MHLQDINDEEDQSIAKTAITLQKALADDTVFFRVVDHNPDRFVVSNNKTGEQKGSSIMAISVHAHVPSPTASKDAFINSEPFQDGDDVTRSLFVFTPSLLTRSDLESLKIWKLRPKLLSHFANVDLPAVLENKV